LDDALRVLREVFSPTRMLILFELAMGERSLTELSKRLGLAPSTIHYHLKRLEKLGLIEVSRVEQRGNVLVKYYRASEDILVLGRSIPRKSMSELSRYIAPCIAMMMLKIIEKVASRRRGIGALDVVIVRLDSEQAKKVIHELQGMISRVKELEKESQRRDYLLAIALTAVAQHVA